ncbi:MAG: hypothetical protein AAF467_17045 [Actinomycetota bacterium]
MDHDLDATWRLALCPRPAPIPLAGRSLGPHWVAALVACAPPCGGHPGANEPVAPDVAALVPGGVDGAVARAVARTLADPRQVGAWRIRDGPASGALVTIIRIEPLASGLVAAMPTVLESIFGTGGVPPVNVDGPIAALMLDVATLLIAAEPATPGREAVSYEGREAAIVARLREIAATAPTSEWPPGPRRPIVRFRARARLAIFDAEVSQG